MKIGFRRAARHLRHETGASLLNDILSTHIRLIIVFVIDYEKGMQVEAH